MVGDSSGHRTHRKRLIEYLACTSGGRHLLTFLSTIWPFKAIIANRKLISREIKALGHARRDGMEIALVVDFNSNFPGMGDFLVVVVLANVLARSGLKVNFFGVPVREYRHQVKANYPVVDNTRQAKMLEVATSLCKVDISLLDSEEKLSELLQSSTQHVLFRESLTMREDISHHCYGLINDLVADKSMGFESSHVRDSLCAEYTEGAPGHIGFHVRSSDFDHHRNPSLAIAMRDLRAIITSFPNHEVRFFGERDSFESLHKNLEDCEAERFRFQRSKSFQDATVEAIQSDLWFQRLGGGIGTGVMFSQTPYLILSGDIPAIRLWKGNQRSPIIWSSARQVLSYSPFRAGNKKMDKLLRNLKISINNQA
jgi:hypothetical protein